MAGFMFNFTIEGEKEEEKEGEEEEEKEGEEEEEEEEEKEEEEEEEKEEVESELAPDMPAPNPGTEQPATCGSTSACEISVQPFHMTLLEHVCFTCQEYIVPGTYPQRMVLKYVNVEDIGRVIGGESDSKDPRFCTDQTGSKTGNGTPSTVLLPTHAHELQTLLQFVETQHSDLVSGVYEGGLKIWECAFDLTEYLAESRFHFQGLRVLELGCGVGLPGLLALVSGAACVHFQDYNPEVIKFVTIPNALLNERSGNETQTGTSLVSKCRFFSGDWDNFTALVKSSEGSLINVPCYDVILTSETIYSAASQPKLLTTLKQLINPESGVVFLAAKRYYFGVGGSVQMFRELVESEGYFNVHECKTISSSVPRVVFKLVRRSQNF